MQDIENKINNVNDLDWYDIMEKYNLNGKIAKDTLRKASSTIFGNAFVSGYFRQKSEIETSDETTAAINNYNSETSINKDGTFTSNKLIVIKDEDLKNKDFLLKAHGFDKKEWELVSARNNIWNVYSKQDGIKELYSSKIVVKPRKFDMDFDTMSEWFDKLDRNYSLDTTLLSKHSKIVPSELNHKKMLLIDIADLHLNLQASMFVTGNEYNCEIAETLFFYVINDIIERTNNYCDFEKIIFCIGGDMLNADNLSGTTTKGTPQDNDLHLYEAYEKVCELTIKAIDLLKERTNCVDVIYVPGNHDKVCGFKLAKYIDAWFRNDNRVNVDCSPYPRKYIKYGKTLLVFAHDGNIKTLPRVIADEARDFWSEIDTTEVFLQHLHSEQVLLEDNNMRIQRLPTISAKSVWTVEKGFGSKRQCKTFIFDIDDGLTDVLYTPIKNK